MHLFGGTVYIEFGGQSRPLRFGTNQTACFCSLRNIDLQRYGEMMSNEKELGSLVTIRDLIYSALWAGARSEKLPTDFDNEDVGDWFDEVEDKAALIKKVGEALHGVPSKNGKAQEETLKVSA